MEKYYVNEPFDMGGRATICKGAKTVALHDVVNKLNHLESENRKLRGIIEFGLGEEDLRQDI